MATQTFAPIALGAGQQITFPDPAGNQFHVPPNVNGVKITLGLSPPDKLAVGETLAVNAFFSPDNGTTWNFAVGVNWTSYGPNGLTVTNIDGTTLTNPDPALFVPLNGLTGQLARLTALSNVNMTVTPTFATF